MKNRRIQWAITIFVGIVVIIGIIILFLGQFIRPQLQRLPFVSNSTVINVHERYRLDPEIPSIVYGNARRPSAQDPFLEDGVIYLPISFFVEEFDRFLFWDAGSQALIVTTHTDILVFYPDQLRFYVNGAHRQLQHPIRQTDGGVFIPASLAEALYPVTASHYDTYNMIVIKRVDAPQTTAYLTRRADIRHSPSRNSPIATRAQAGSMVTVFEESENGDFTRILDENGLPGWVATSSLSETITTVPQEDLDRPMLLDGFVENNTLPPSVRRQPVVIAWDFVDCEHGNAALMDVELHESVNVLSPTWLVIDAEGVTGIPSDYWWDYLSWARGHGVEVWPNVIDSPNSSAFLTSFESRQDVMTSLLWRIEHFSLNGVNIGFEHVSPERWPYLVQFIRELSVELRRMGVTLSINIPVPCENTDFMRRDLLAQSVDFIVVMAYEEHWPGAPDSGPVASEPFVRRAIEESLEDIPAGRLILGIPFYNRIWREIVIDNTPETRTYRHHGTAYTREWFEYNGVEWEWLPQYGKYYGQFAALEGDEAVIYKAWLECERSIGIKLDMYREFNLAGVAVWNRNFRHNEGLWEVMGEYFR